MLCKLLIFWLATAITLSAQEELPLLVGKLRTLSASKDATVEEFRQMDLVEKQITAAIKCDAEIKFIREVASEELLREDKVHAAFYRITRILFAKDKDLPSTFRALAKTQNANPVLMKKLIAKLGIEFRKDWHFNGSPVKPDGLTDLQLAEILKELFEHQPLAVGIDAIDLLTGYGWQEASVKPVDKKLGLELLRQVIRADTTPELFKCAMERKLHFEKEIHP